MAVTKPARICFRVPPERPHTNRVVQLLIFQANIFYLSDVGIGLTPTQQPLLLLSLASHVVVNLQHDDLSNVHPQLNYALYSSRQGVW